MLQIAKFYSPTKFFIVFHDFENFSFHPSARIHNNSCSDIENANRQPHSPESPDKPTISTWNESENTKTERCCTLAAHRLCHHQNLNKPTKNYRETLSRQNRCPASVQQTPKLTSLSLSTHEPHTHHSSRNRCRRPTVVPLASLLAARLRGPPRPALPLAGRPPPANLAPASGQSAPRLSRLPALLVHTHAAALRSVFRPRGVSKPAATERGGARRARSLARLVRVPIAALQLQSCRRCRRAAARATDNTRNGESRDRCTCHGVRETGARQCIACVCLCGAER